MRRIPRFLAVLAVLLCTALVAACAVPTPGENRLNTSNTADPDPDPALVSEALAFSEVTLPPGVTVLGADHIGSLDALFEVALSAPPMAANSLLENAGVAKSLVTGKQRFMPAMSGFTVEPGPAVFFAADKLPAGGSRKSTVFREFYVNRSDPDHTFVYIWAYNT